MRSCSASLTYGKPLAMTLATRDSSKRFPKSVTASSARWRRFTRPRRDTGTRRHGDGGNGGNRGTGEQGNGGTGGQGEPETAAMSRGLLSPTLPLSQSPDL